MISFKRGALLGFTFFGGSGREAVAVLVFVEERVMLFLLPVEAWSRLPPIIIILLTGMTGTMLPMWMELSPRTEAYVFWYGNSMAAGILAAAGFVHLFPDAVHALDGAVPMKFPLAGFVAMCGALTIFVMDNIIQSAAVQTRFPLDKDSAVGSDRADIELEEERGMLYEERRGGNGTGAFAAQTSAEEVILRKDGLITYMLFAALSLHSVFEGLAMGSNMRYPAKFYTIFWVIMAHKFFASLALGISLARSNKALTVRKVCKPQTPQTKSSK